MVGFIFGGSTGETPESLKRKREMIEQMIMGQRTPQNWGEGAGAILKGIAAGIENRRLNKAEEEGNASANSLKDRIAGLITGTNPDIFGGGSVGGVPMSGAADELASTQPGATPDMTGNDVYSGFMDTVKTQVDNPYALAAIAATGSAESKFSPGNVNRTWSDPSESGKAGRAGGIMSWRDGRYDAMAATGDISPAGQAKYFLNEDPQLIAKLNGAKSVEEAQSLMNNAWKFAGYNRPGGEAARRLQMAKSYLPTFQGGGNVAAASPEEAFSTVMPELGGGGPSLSDEVAEYQQTPEYSQQFPGRQQQGFDTGRFSDPSAMQPVQGMGGLQSALAGQQQPAGQQAIESQMQGDAIPQQFQGSQQLMGAQGGMMPALMGGQPASAQQVAQAQQAGQQMPDMGPQSGDNLINLLYQAVSSPFYMADPGRAAMAKMLLEQELQKQQSARDEQRWRGRQDYEQQLRQQDPSYQLEQDYRRAQLDKMRREAEGVDNPATVQTSVVLDDGTSVLVMNNGQRRVVSASGEELSGQAAANAIRAARDYGVENQRAIYGGRRAGTLGSDIELGGDAEAAKAGGKSLAEFRAQLPQIESSAGELLSSIDSLSEDKYLDRMVGPADSWLPNISGDAARVQSKMDQIGGQSFLQAFNMLRGAGQITEQEGKKATEAMSRLNTAQSEKDYRAALAELRSVVERSVTNARRRAGGDQLSTPQGGADYRSRYGLE